MRVQGAPPRFGIYQIDSAARTIKLTLYDQDPAAYHNVKAHGPGLWTTRYLPEKLRLSFTGRYRLEDDQRLVVEETTGANQLALYLRRNVHRVLLVMV